MGLTRSVYHVGKAVAKGGGASEIARGLVVGMLPPVIGTVVNGLASDANISRVATGIRNVADRGRRSTFHSETGLPQAPSTVDDAPISKPTSGFELTATGRNPYTGERE
jgi:hypothetical protein